VRDAQSQSKHFCQTLEKPLGSTKRKSKNHPQCKNSFDAGVAVSAQELTESNVHDGTQTGKLLPEVSLGKVYADGAYPGKASMDTIALRGGTPIIPVRYGTAIVQKSPSPGQELRNQLVREKRKAGGKKAWKKESGYHRRSLVETHMFRLKTIFGGWLKSRSFANQKIEARIMAKTMNRMTSLGMPLTETVLLNP